jgi:hypothetical protein
VAVGAVTAPADTDDRAARAGADPHGVEPVTGGVGEQPPQPGSRGTAKWQDHRLRPGPGVQVYAGPLLDGFHLSESTEFGYWLDERRAEFSHAYVGALLALAGQQEQSGDVHAWVGTCRRLVTVDPYSAVHALALMKALDAAGDRPAQSSTQASTHSDCAQIMSSTQIQTSPHLRRGFASSRPVRNSEQRIYVDSNVDSNCDSNCAFSVAP